MKEERKEGNFCIEVQDKIFIRNSQYRLTPIPRLNSLLC